MKLYHWIISILAIAIICGTILTLWLYEPEPTDCPVCPTIIIPTPVPLATPPAIPTNNPEEIKKKIQEIERLEQEIKELEEVLMQLNDFE